MAESGDLSDTAHPGEGPRAADMGDGALVATAGVEEGGGCPQPQCQFWAGRRMGVRIRAVRAGPAKVDGTLGSHIFWKDPDPWPQPMFYDVQR